MLCERCQKQEATIHLTQTRQGKTNTYHLCDACAREIGVGHYFSDYFGTLESLMGSDMLGGGSIFNITGGIPDFGAKTTHSAICPNCGQSFDEFRRTGLFGCSKCYEAFGDRLDAVFRRVQGGTRHIGRRTNLSAGQKETQLLQGKLKDLRKSLNQAVSDEAYEEAARIRDEIKILEKRIEANQSSEGGSNP